MYSKVQFHSLVCYFQIISLICLVLFFSSLIDVFQAVKLLMHILLCLAVTYTEYHVQSIMYRVSWMTVAIVFELGSCAGLRFMVSKKELIRHQQELASKSFRQTITGVVSGRRILFSFWKEPWGLQEIFLFFIIALGALIVMCCACQLDSFSFQYIFGIVPCIVL